MASNVETLIRGAITKGVMKIAEFNAGRAKADGPHPFLSGLHVPMSGEETITDLAVSGTIPAELNGSYLRNGPNPVTPPNPAVYHWFTGTGMVHGIRLKDGKALWYRNRWVRGQEVSDALGEAPAPGIRAEGFDSPNTNVVGLMGNTWAIVEAGGFPVRLDEDLNTVAHDPFGGTLTHAFSAHPHVDPVTGEAHAICYKGQSMDTIWHVVVGTDGKVRREEPVSVVHGPSIHDCMITKNYIIILDLPVTFSMKKLLSGQRFPYAWNPDHKARVGLLPRKGKGSETIWCDVEPCYIFHPANGYETDDGQVILDACVHNSMFAESTQGPDSTSTPFERWTINPATRSVERRVIDPASQEFPRPNESLIGKSYRYAYCLALPEPARVDFAADSKLYKHDLVAGTREVHDFGPGLVPGEFVFVPKEKAAKEDDGWLMGLVINVDSDTTDLVILDAADFTGKPVARITVPHRIPPGFHGNWVAAL